MWRDSLVVAMLSLCLAVLLVVSGCSGSVSVTTASLSEVTMAKSVDSTTQAPIDKTDTFSPDTQVIYCTAKLSNAPSDTKVKAEWIASEAEGVAKDSLIDTVTVTTEGTRYVAFSLSKSQAAWPVGKYIVKLYIDDKQVTTANFSVVASATTSNAPVISTPAAARPTADAPAAIPPPVASLTEATMALSVDDATQEPKEKTSVFKPDAEVFYCTVKLNEAPPNTKVKAEWIASEAEGVQKDYLIDTVTLDADGTRYLGFTLTRSNEAWPVGKYAVKLYLNDKQVTTVNFTVAK